MAHPTSLPRRSRGLSLIELMIAMTIGLFLLTALASVYLGASTSNRELTRSARQIEDGRYSIQAISEDLSLAGYFGYFYSPVTPSAIPDPCELLPSQASLRVPLQGYDSPASPASPLSGCLADADHVAGTDVLVVRRADTNVSVGGTIADGSSTLVANELYVQANSDTSNSSNPLIAVGNTPGTYPLLLKDSATRAPVRKLHVQIYYVAPCSVPTGGGSSCTGASDDNGRPIPTLKRLELRVDSGGALAWVVTPIAEGVEMLQVEYGLDANGDGVPDGAFVAAPASAADWANVVAANVYLIVRNTEPSSGYTDMKSYALGVAGTMTSTANGGTLDPNYKRKAYSAQVRLVNPASRRETP